MSWFHRLAMLIVLGNFTLYSVVGIVLVLMEKIATLKNLIEFSKTMGIAMLATTVVASMFGYYAWTKGEKKYEPVRRKEETKPEEIRDIRLQKLEKAKRREAGIKIKNPLIYFC